MGGWGGAYQPALFFFFASKVIAVEKLALSARGGSHIPFPSSVR
jgi:hypothetical protein